MTDLTWFLVIAFIFEVSSHGSRPLIPLQMSALGSTPGEIGLLFAAASILPLLVSIPVGRLADRVGPVRVMGLGTAAVCLSFVGMALAPSSYAVAAAYGVMWGGVSSAIVAQQVLIASLSNPDERDRNYGWLGAVNSAGQLVGPAVGGMAADFFGLRVVFVSSAVVALLSLLALRRLARAGKAVVPTPTGDGAAGGRSWFGGLQLLAMPRLRLILLVAFLVVVALDVRNSFLSVYLNNSGYSKATIGLLFSVLAAAGILIRTSTGWLTRRLGNWRLLAAASALAVPALFLLPLASQMAAVAIAVAALGASFGLSLIMTMSITAGAVEPAERGNALGIRMSVQMLAMLISPLLLGALAATLGLGAVFIGAGSAMLLACGLSLRGAADRPRR